MNEPAPADNHKASDHGSNRSYIIGFILSLIFTIIPYLMVTRQILSGTTLLLIVLGLAIVQLFVQIIFFLHLGRGPKPFYNIVFFSATAGFIIVVIGASLLIMNNLYRNMSPREVTVRIAQEENIAEINGLETGACQGNNANHIVAIDSEKSVPEFIIARRCDTLSFSSADGAERELEFLVSGTPASYGGQYEITVRGDRAKIITLNEIGTFEFRERPDGPIIGRFVVEP